MTRNYFIAASLCSQQTSPAIQFYNELPENGTSKTSMGICGVHYSLFHPTNIRRLIYLTLHPGLCYNGNTVFTGTIYYHYNQATHCLSGMQSGHKTWHEEEHLASESLCCLQPGIHHWQRDNLWTRNYLSSQLPSLPFRKHNAKSPNCFLNCHIAWQVLCSFIWQQLHRRICICDVSWNNYCLLAIFKWSAEV